MVGVGWGVVDAAPANGTVDGVKGRDCGRASWRDVGWFFFRN